jgi:hypothetical protein
VGGLLFVAVNTRPDIAHTVMWLARRMQSPAQLHWRMALRVLRYLKGKPGGLVFTDGHGSTPTLTGYADASFASDQASAKSTTGFVLMLCGAAVCWRSKLQECVARSTTEAEYIALALAGAEAYAMRQLLAFLGCEQLQPTVLYEDNAAALLLAANPVAQQRSRSINVKYHYIRELVGKQIVDVLAIRTGAQHADLLTKTLPGPAHKLHTAALLGRT